jgi:DNA-binding response OmpR family regulator
MNQDPRVLIVESNNVLRMMLFTILRHQPVAVDTAASVEDALAKVSQCDYALALVDMDMPREAGPTFIDQFRKQRPGATTFILAVRDPNSNAFMDPAHVSAVLNKPLEIDILAEVVRECAAAVPPPDDPLSCPPAESEVRSNGDRGPWLTN